MLDEPDQRAEAAMNKPTRDCRLDSILMSDPRPVILENWGTELRNGRLYLDGNVWGHAEIADGTRIRTARVSWLLEDVGIAQTATLNYILTNRR
jgi:hypothetical protein